MAASRIILYKSKFIFHYSSSSCIVNVRYWDSQSYEVTMKSKNSFSLWLIPFFQYPYEVDVFLDSSKTIFSGKYFIQFKIIKNHKKQRDKLKKNM